jgi:hypothetical protein
LIALAAKDHQQKSVGLVNPGLGIRACERAVNDNLFWRRAVGYNAEEVRRMVERTKKLKRNQ